MPLEQIRPLLSLESRCVNGRNGSSKDPKQQHDPSSSRISHPSSSSSSIAPSSSQSSPTSPHASPDDNSIAYAGAILGPTSPSVRSNKDLASGGGLGLGGSSAHASASSHGSTSTLDKLGGVGGVTRSGSWRGNTGISVIGRGRGQSQGQNTYPHCGSPPSSDQATQDSSINSIGIGSPDLSSSNPASAERGLSRASTIGSHHSSYSAAAFSLRSVSSRHSSTPSNSSTNTTPSASPPGSVRKLSSTPGQAHFGQDPAKLARHTSDVSHLSRNRAHTRRDELDGSTSPRSEDDTPKRHSSFVGPGVSRIKSIGRGGSNSAGSSFAPSPQQSPSPPRSRSPHGIDTYSHAGPSRIKSIGRAAPSWTQSNHFPSQGALPAEASGTVTGVPSASSSVSATTPPHSIDTPTQTSSSASSDSTMQDVRPPLAAPTAIHAIPSSISSPATADTMPRERQVLSPRSGNSSAAVARSNTGPWHGYFTKSNPASPNRHLDGGRGFPFPYTPFDNYSARGGSRSPAADSNTAQTATFADPQSADYPNLPPPRKHTGGYVRTRSAFSRSVASYGASAQEQTTPFAGPGEQGGRRAARARARHPSLANLDNAPFSVLEEMRAWGLRAGIPRPTIAVTQPPTATPSTSQTSIPRRDNLTLSGIGAVAPTPMQHSTGPLQSPLQSGRDSPHRPLSPIAHASPDAQWALAAATGAASSVGRQPVAFASMASLSDAMSDVGSSECGDGSATTDNPRQSNGRMRQSHGRESTLLAPAETSATLLDRSVSPGLAAAAQAASDAVESQADQDKTISSPMRKRRSRPSILSSDALDPTSSVSSSHDGSRAASPNLSASGSFSSPRVGSATGDQHSRPRMSRSSTFANPSASSQGRTSTPGSPLQTATTPAMTPSLAAPAPSVTHVLRTPTTEEWARYLASQGLDIGGRSRARPRSSTGRSLASLASQSRMSRASLSRTSDGTYVNPGSADDVTMTAVPGAVRQARDKDDRRSSFSDEEDDLAFDHSVASLDDLLPDFLELPGTEDSADTGGRWAGIPRGRLQSATGSTRSRSSSSSSDSSQGRMEALHAVISMPPSRRGSPPGSPSLATADFNLRHSQPRPSLSSTRRVPEERARAVNDQSSGAGTSPKNLHAGGATSGSSGALSTSPLAALQDPSLTQHVQHLYGYAPAPQGQRRSIDDFEIISDVGRGAYGLVKLARLKSSEGRSGFQDQQEYVVKYIIKSRILADCWRRHRVLGPIPVEIHVMDQLRRLRYTPPAHSPPWDPHYLWQKEDSEQVETMTGDDLLRESPPLASPASSPATPMHRRKAVLTDNATEACPGQLQQTSGQSRDQVTPRSSVHQTDASVDSAKQTHPGLGTMLDFFEDESFYYLVMPRFGQGTDLFDYIESHPYGLITREARCILGQVADGVRFLHEHDIVHRDIKDENVILDGSGRAQLIDFGSATHVRPGRLFDTFSGTLDYAAAEILRGDKYAGKEQDVWAMGVVAYVCLVGDAPFWNGEEAMTGLQPGTRAMTALEERCASEPPVLFEAGGERSSPQEDPEAEHQNPASSLTPEQRDLLLQERAMDLAGQADGGGKLLDAKDLIENCVALDTRDRPSASMLCRHVFLAGDDALSNGNAWRGWKGWERLVE